MKYVNQREGSLGEVVSGIRIDGYLYEFEATVLVRVKATLTYQNAGLLLYFHEFFVRLQNQPTLFKLLSK